MVRTRPALAAVLPLGLALALAGGHAAAAPANFDAATVKRGEYLALAGDCVACHTAPGGKPMAGGLALASPLGDIIATNITPSTTHGIGNYTFEQFSAALRQGIRADGAHLYPAMPYTAYALVTDDDTRALYAYFMHGVAPVDAAPARQTALGFPFNIRGTMAVWNRLYLDTAPFKPDASKSAQFNRGAYLARGLAHCGACHTPRNTLMAEDRRREFAGAMLGGWFASNITPDLNSGVGGWTEQELVDYMQHGRAAGKAQAAGPMAEAVDNSLRYLSEDDLRAIASYLKGVPARRSGDSPRPPYAWGAPVAGLVGPRGVAHPQDPDKLTGPQLYDAHCATCHQARGEGSFDGGLPPLFHNTAVGSTNPSNLVMAILEGVRRGTEHPELRMPGYAHIMSDVQVATLSNYLTARLGNPAVKVTAHQVATLRAGGPPSSLPTVVRIGMAILVALIVILVVVLLVRRRR